MNELSPLTDVKGVGDKTKDLFQKIGVYTVGDILLRFPRDYMQYPPMEEISEIDFMPNHSIALVCQIKSTPLVKKTARMQITLLSIKSENKMIQAIWYRAPYIKNSLTLGKTFVLYGKLIHKNGVFTLEQPEIFEPEKYLQRQKQIYPVYSLTKGLSNSQITKIVLEILKDQILLFDCFSPDFRERYNLCEYNYAVKQIHFPDQLDNLIVARRRLVFQEFFLFILGMQFLKERQEGIPNSFEFKNKEWLRRVVNKLPYELTDGQKKALQEIIGDMQGPYLMQRLLQGDVGSGKTIVAFLAMLLCLENKKQAAIMAPTEVLAVQHYENFKEWAASYELDIQVVLLTGSMTQKQKREAYEIIENNANVLIVGTHALIQEKVKYNQLALVITDEQHRFGVKQREVFAQKGSNPHILVMSATPIPRTLAIIIYGDLDISVIDHVPAQRLPIKNCVVDMTYREKAYQFIRKQVEEGHQAYVICPLVEETENLEAENVIDYSKTLQDKLGAHIKVAFLHGKMKGKEKNQIMEAFSKNEIQVLVSTTVIEVGVNVPNATVMMIENADRFGLAQLHQLRGRVGRGSHQSYCIMINSSKSKTAKKRLEILNKSNDGFFIASQDLKLRGPGDFFGIQQSGDLVFQLGDIYQDASVLQEASDSVKQILSEDPDLSKTENASLRKAMNQFLQEQVQKMNL